MKLSNALLMSVLLATSACTQNEPPPPEPPLAPAVANLTDGYSKTWRVVRVQEDSTDSFVDSLSCDGDNRFIFRLEGNQFRFYTGTLKCNVAEPDSLLGTWEYRNQGAYLKIKKQDGSTYLDYEVVSQASAQMVVSYITLAGKNRRETWEPR
jgi:hypothetical protein